MSLICTIYVPDGIVMAADSRVMVAMNPVNPNPKTPAILFASDNHQQIFMLEKYNVGISVSGATLIKGQTLPKYIKRFESELSQSDVAADIALKLRDRLSEDNINSMFHVSGYDGDEAFVYSVNGKECKRLNTKDGKLINGAGWAGDSVLLGKIFNAEPKLMINFDLMPVLDAVRLAEFLIKTSAEYQSFEPKPQGIGGAIDILVLTSDGAKWVKHKLFKPEN